MYNYFIIRLTNRIDGTAGNVVHPFEAVEPVEEGGEE